MPQNAKEEKKENEEEGKKFRCFYGSCFDNSIPLALQLSATLSSVGICRFVSLITLHCALFNLTCWSPSETLE